MLKVVVIGVNLMGSMAPSMRVKNLLFPLIKKGSIKVYNLINEPDFESEKEMILQEDIQITHFNLSYRLKKPLSLFTYLSMCNKILKDLAQNGSKRILFVFGYPDIQNISLIYNARKYNYKIVFDIVEDNRFVPSFSSIQSRIRNWTSLRLFNRISSLGHGCIAISTHLFKLCAEKSRGLIPVIHIPISVDISKLNNLQQSSSIPDSSFKMFYGGSFGEKDGISVMIKAFEEVAYQFPQVHIYLSGKASKRHSKILTGIFKGTPLRDKITHLGYLDEKKYFSVIKDMDVLLVLRIDDPYANAGFPFKLGEFLATGNPVVVSRVGDVKIYLTDKINALLTEPRDVESIKDAIIYLIQNPVKAKEIGKNGLKIAQTHFCADKQSKKLLEFFHSVSQ